MQQLKKNLNSIGLGLIFFALAALRIWPYRKTLPLVLGLLGVAALAVYIVLNLAVLKQGFKRKSFLYSSNLVMIIVLVLGILVLVNMFFSRHHARFDFTEAKVHSLSDQSKTVLKNLKDEIRIKSFFREDNYLRPQMENLMKIYTYHSNKIKHEFIDPDKNPGLVKRYDVTTDGTSIFESGDKENRITTVSEEEITNTIIKISRESKKVIYFLEGHGEASIEEAGEQGYSTTKSELEKLGYEVKKLSLALEDNFPDDLALLVVPGPDKDLLPNELETIRGYIKRGGRVFFLVDPETAPGMKGFLAEFGVKLEDDLIIDTVSRLLGGDYFMPVVSEYEFHAITEKFRYATFFPYARSVDKLEKTPEGVRVEVLAKSSPNSWGERQLDVQEVRFDKDKDREGPVPLAVAATVKFGKDEKDKEEIDKEAKDKDKLTEKENTAEKGGKLTQTEEQKRKENMKLEKDEEVQKRARNIEAEGRREDAHPEEMEKAEGIMEEDLGESEIAAPEGRIAVFGDSDFASNTYYNLSGNGNLFLNTVNWLAEEADLIAIQPQTASPRTIHLTPSQGRLIFFVSLIILPLAILITGISVWLRRRSR